MECLWCSVHFTGADSSHVIAHIKEIQEIHGCLSCRKCTDSFCVMVFTKREVMFYFNDEVQIIMLTVRRRAERTNF